MTPIAGNATVSHAQPMAWYTTTRTIAAARSVSM
jgi:hypothetical protein